MKFCFKNFKFGNLLIKCWLLLSAAENWAVLFYESLVFF